MRPIRIARLVGDVAIHSGQDVLRAGRLTGFGESFHRRQFPDPSRVAFPECGKAVHYAPLPVTVLIFPSLIGGSLFS